MAAVVKNAQTAQDVPESVVVAAQAGCPDAFAAIYRRHHGDIRRYVYRRMGGHEDAADLTQDAFVKMFRAIGRTNGRPLKILPWAYRIATNVCLDYLRHRKLIHWQTLVTDGDKRDTPEEHQYSRQAQQAQAIERQSIQQPLFPQPERAVELAELVKDVNVVLDDLHPAYRDMLVLREWAGLGYQETAELLGTTLSAVKSRINRARQEFRQRWTGTYRMQAAQRLSARFALRESHIPIIAALRAVIEESNRTSWKTSELTVAVHARGVVLPAVRPSLVVGGLLKNIKGLVYHRATRVWKVVD